MKAKVVKKQSDIDDIARQAIETEDKIRELEEKHKDIFDRWRSLQDDKNGYIERLKVAAREVAVRGETKVLLDNSKIHVNVVGKESRWYDYDKAVKVWPKNVLEKCLNYAIDKNKVKSCLDLELLSDDDLRKVEVVEPATPAVTIRFP